jgi:hypothetical protein
LEYCGEEGEKMAETKDKPAHKVTGGDKPGSHTADAPAPETAVAETAAAADDSEEWVFTANRSTGEVVKVERVEAATGERRELSLDEYSALWAAVQQGAEAQAADYLASVGQTNYPYGYEAGYYQGLAAALGYAGMTPEQQAYYQGVADYAAYMGLS